MAYGVEELARIDSERRFHDDRYRDDPRASQDRFYRGLQESENQFRDLVDRFQPEDRVLELGCGIDSVGYGLAARGIDLVGIDISSVAVERATEVAAQRKLTSASFVEMNAERLDFCDASFDGVVGSAVLHHLDVSLACAEMARVLRPGGRAVFLEPLGHNPLINRYRDRTPGSRTEHEHPLRREDFNEARRHFQEVEVDTHHLLAIASSPISGRRFGSVLHKGLTRLDRVVIRAVPPLRWQAWIAVVEMRRPRGRRSVTA